MTREERHIAINDYDNEELLQLLKTHKPCVRPSWSRILFYVKKSAVRGLSFKQKIEFTVSETQNKTKIIILKN